MRKIDEIMARLRDQQALHKFICYAERYGAHGVDWHENWLYSDEQERFFAQYERQMQWKSRLISRRQAKKSIR